MKLIEGLDAAARTAYARGLLDISPADRLALPLILRSLLDRRRDELANMVLGTAFDDLSPAEQAALLSGHVAQERLNREKEELGALVASDRPTWERAGAVLTTAERTDTVREGFDWWLDIGRERGWL